MIYVFTIHDEKSVDNCHRFIEAGGFDLSSFKDDSEKTFHWNDFEPSHKHSILRTFCEVASDILLSQLNIMVVSPEVLSWSTYGFNFQTEPDFWQKNGSSREVQP